MQKYEKKTKETCQNGKKISQNGKMFVKTEKSEFLGLFLPFFYLFCDVFPSLATRFPPPSSFSRRDISLGLFP